MILVWPLDLKFLYELAATMGGNFKSATLGVRRAQVRDNDVAKLRRLPRFRTGEWPR